MAAKLFFGFDQQFPAKQHGSENVTIGKPMRK
jgi:hypothetical protein